MKRGYNAARGYLPLFSGIYGLIFKKIKDTKGTFHARMGSIKDRNGMDLTEAEDIKRDGKNTQKNCATKSFTTQIITMV